MKKMFLLLLPVLFLYGCATVSNYDIQRKRIAEDFWNDKISADTYKESLNSINQDEAQHKVFGALCDQCERYSTFNLAQWNSSPTITCPYCGRIQDAKMASNRYTYLKQQQEAQANQQMWTNIAQSFQKAQQESAERRIESAKQLQEQMKEFNKPGTAWNPIHVKVDN